MNFMDVNWADSNIEYINIEYNKATVLIWNEILQKRFSVHCLGLVGLTDLCIWDDTIITNAAVYPHFDSDNDFLRNLYMAYDKNYNYGGRSLSEGVLEMRVELVNHISFSIYCLRIDVVESTE